jgi:hypothetical protein
MKRLLNLGFIKIGHWSVEGNHIRYHLESHQKTRNVLYSFVSNGTIMYIGKTTTTLTKRMYGYQNPGPSQRTNIRVKKEMQYFLANNQPIDILLLVDNGLLKYGDYRINLAAGLEDTLLFEISPEWNFSGKNKKNQVKMKTKVNKTIFDNPMTVQNTMTDTFEVVLGQTYFNQGFFNVKRQFSSRFGSHKEVIQIQLGADSKNIMYGYINRTANNNGSPRIMGGKALSEWVKNNFSLDGILIVHILTPISIRLDKKHNKYS